MITVRCSTSGRDRRDYDVDFDDNGEVTAVWNVPFLAPGRPGIHSRRRATWHRDEGCAMTVTAKCAAHAAIRKLRGAGDSNAND